MDKSEQAYRDFYHKIKASVSLDEWKAIWNFVEKRLTQPAASAEHQQLREFYDVLTDDELIVAQQHHIEKLQATLPGRAPFPVRVREG